ncbi:MAG: cofactor-independent phosphoglycerate mutase [Candidatus Adiutrix intracellularis]|jgi:2,3-bisphosphoglycerate-independent phosphoglycerate mutase|nr:cofactor-independent phosphoglycerate mutase [Candidatus Adiutrix intracellularis]
MKYVILIGDGMGDYPCLDLGGRTPLAAAPTPNLDFMAQNGLLGLARTVPPSMTPGSDVAIMSLMGYQPQGLLTGRGPLEAAAKKLDFSPMELIFRLNFVTLKFSPGRVSLCNHAAGNISTTEAEELLDALRKKLPLGPGYYLYPGVGYRHLLLWPDPAPDQAPSYPPHDYRDQDIGGLLSDPAAREIMNLVRASWPILEHHPVNKKRRARNLPSANSIWLWGQGKRVEVKTYLERWGLTGAAISAVDLIRGLGVITGLETPVIPGATGWLDTNYQGKVEATLEALSRLDLAVLHFEGPDEASHQGELASKLQAIADFDAKIVGPLLRALPDFGSFRILAACDHFTPLKIKTHVADPVPFLIYGQPTLPGSPSGRAYTEANAAATGLLVEPGAALSGLFFGPEK